jgi:hypothetical protein
MAAQMGALMTDISVIFASRGRYAALADAVDSLRDNATDVDHIEVIVAMDPDDLAMNYVKQSRYGNGDASSIWVAPERYGYLGLHHYLNALAKQASGQWLMWFNDDMRMCTPGWDKRVLASRPAVLWPHANHVHHANIAPIWPKAWSDAVGHASPTTHMDTYLQRVGESLGRHDRVGVSIIHNRADVTGQNDDETYRDGRKKLGSEGMEPNWDEAWFQRQVAKDVAVIRGLL